MAGEGLVGVERLSDRVSLTWAGGATSTFHHLWLRDNCACPACRHQSIPERLVDTLSIPDDIAPATTDISVDGDLVVVWPDDAPLDVPRRLARRARLRRCSEAGRRPPRAVDLGFGDRAAGDRLRRDHDGRRRSARLASPDRSPRRELRPRRADHARHGRRHRRARRVPAQQQLRTPLGRDLEARP